MCNVGRAYFLVKGFIFAGGVSKFSSVDRLFGSALKSDDLGGFW